MSKIKTLETLNGSAEGLRDAVEAWEDAVNMVQDAIHTLTEGVDEDLLPTQIQNLIKEIRQQEPDLSPPQDLKLLADDLYDSTPY